MRVSGVCTAAERRVSSRQLLQGGLFHAQYVIDAFTDHVFAGNPAAVCVMDRWLDEAKMMAITIENNLSETAFAVREGEKYHLRWFAPGGEIDLCGHATLGPPARS